MKNSLILVEGIPGSGKSTMALKLKEYLENKGEKVRVYSEGDYHPADLAWNSLLTRKQYDELLIKYSNYKKVIKENTHYEGQYVIVPYTKLYIDENAGEMVHEFEKYEISDGKLPLDKFIEITKLRWSNFGKSNTKDKIIIFECAYLQNQINELLGSYDEDEEFTIKYMKELIEEVMSYNPKLIYLQQPNVYETIKRVSLERVNAYAEGDDWIDRVIEWVEVSPYGKKHNLSGFEGVVNFFERRRELELKVTEKLEIDKAIIDNPDYNWDKVFDGIIESL